MTKKGWLVLFLLAVVLLVILVGATLVVLNIFHPQEAKASTTVDDVLTLTLNSYLKWNTASGAAQITFYGPNGEQQIYVDSFDIVQPDKAYIESVSQDGSGQNTIWISDGTKSYSLDETSKTYQAADLPKFSRDYSLLPKTLADIQSDVVYDNPFAMVIPLPVREYLYPQWFPQGGGTYNLTGEDSILDRKVWVVDYQKGNNDCTAWIDQQTGIILKYTQLTDEKLILAVEFTQIGFDASIDDSRFSPPSGYSAAASQ